MMMRSRRIEKEKRTAEENEKKTENKTAIELTKVFVGRLGVGNVVEMQKDPTQAQRSTHTASQVLQVSVDDVEKTVGTQTCQRRRNSH